MTHWNLLCLFTWAVTSNLQNFWSASIYWPSKHTGFLVSSICWICFECLWQVCCYTIVPAFMTSSFLLLLVIFYLCWLVLDSQFCKLCNYWLPHLFRVPSYSTSIEINGEDSREFLAGFAENIGLENSRAATIVSAAVAARTRSCLLQAWVLYCHNSYDVILLFLFES